MNKKLEISSEKLIDISENNETMVADDKAIVKDDDSNSENKESIVKAGLVGAAALALAGCKDGGGGGGGPTIAPPGSVVVLNMDPIADIAVQEGQVAMLNPAATSSVGGNLVFTFTGYMTSNSKQTQVGDAGIQTVKVTVTSAGLSVSQDVRVIVHTGNVTTASLHLARRTSFGMTPNLYYEVDVLGRQAYLEQQLAPASINDNLFQRRIGSVTVTRRHHLKAWTMLHMVYSKKQLLEVMTWFWDNHFNTDINVVRNNVGRDDSVTYERNENEAFRANALGNFRQLLGISAKSPSMLLYLDSAKNRASDSNENYSRELLELHTMGVDGGYTHLDIEAGAEIFTGWHLRNDQFFFNAARHRDVQHNYLTTNNIPNIIPAGGGVAQGEQVLDILASHPETAKFICTKLVTLFVSDIPRQTQLQTQAIRNLIANCVTTYLAFDNSANQDQIAQVLRTIFSSTEFNAAANQNSKVKSPVEFAASIARGLEGETNASALQELVTNMGLNLYEKLEPTGYSEKGVDWISANLLMERYKTADLMLRQNNRSRLETDMIGYCNRHGVTSTNAIVDFFLTRLLGDSPAAARANAIAFLDSPTPFNINNASQANSRLRRLVTLIMSYPQFQFQ